MRDYEKSIHNNPDAQAWAKFFIDTIAEQSLRIEDIDEALMIGWFANAMMAMHDSMKPHEAANEIERLRWENANMEKLWGKSEGTWMEIRDNQDAEIELLRKERDGLREVLQSIKKIPNSEAAYGVIQTFVDDALKDKQ